MSIYTLFCSVCLDRFPHLVAEELIFPHTYDMSDKDLEGGYPDLHGSNNRYRN